MVPLILLCIAGGLAAWFCKTRLDRYVGVAFLALGIAGIVSLQAIEAVERAAARELHIKATLGSP